MIEVRIPKEITEYKEKILLGMSLRQLICFAIAIATSFGVFFLLKGIFSLSTLGTIIMIINIPIIAIGFLKKNGFTMEQWITIVLNQKLSNNKLSYITNLDNENEKEESDKNDNKKKEQSPEWQGYYVRTEKEQKHKREFTSSKIKGARKESRTARRRLYKKSKEA